MPIRKTSILSLLALLPCAAAPAQQTTAEIPVPDDAPYIHAPSGLIFPATLGTFLRVGVHRYAPGESNISVGYNEPRAAIALTAYVYPQNPDRTLAGEFAQVQAGITDVHPGARLLSQQPWVLRQESGEFHGLRARYTFQADWAGRRQDLLSDAYLLPLTPAPAGNDAAPQPLLLKFRITYPASREALSNQLIDDFLARLPLPITAAATTRPTSRPSQ